MTAPLDYVSAGSATSEDKCTAVAIGANGMYAVGQETGTAKDLDAVLIKFLEAPGGPDWCDTRLMAALRGTPS